MNTNTKSQPRASVAAQPTPGPWFVSNGTFEQAHICGYEDVMVAIVSKQDPQCDGGRCTATERANAQLIAAAPMLLAALQKWQRAYHETMQEQREVGHSEFPLTAGLVCETNDAIDAATKPVTATRATICAENHRPD